MLGRKRDSAKRRHCVFYTLENAGVGWSCKQRKDALNKGRVAWGCKQSCTTCLLVQDVHTLTSQLLFYVQSNIKLVHEHITDKLKSKMSASND